MKKVTFVILFLVTFSNVAKADFDPGTTKDISISGFCFGLTGSQLGILERVVNKNEVTLQTIKRISNINEMFMTLLQKELQTGFVNVKVADASMSIGMSLVEKEGPSGPGVLKEFTLCLTALQKAKESGLVN